MDFEIKQEYITTRELKKLFSISKVTLWRILKDNNIRKVKKNTHWYINSQDFINYIKKFNP